MHLSAVPREARRRHRILEATVVTEGYKLSSMAAGNWTQVLYKNSMHS